jgi:glycosyltransferase involved in cell wall biosynthesis
MDWLIDTNNYVIQKHKYFLKMEKNILQKADKVLCSNGGDEFKNKIIKKTDKPTLQYFHYLSKNLFSYKSNDITGQIHLCHIGHLPHSKNLEQFLYGLEIKDYQAISKKNIRVHIYMTIDRKSIYKELKEKGNEQVIFHDPKPLQSLLKEIRNYHFGLMLYQDDKETKKLFGRHHDTVLTTKVFTYLFAGLPIIATNNQQFLNDFIKEYGIGIIVDYNELDNLDQIISKHDYKKLKENIKNNIDKWSIEYNHKTLVDFLKK